MIGRRLRRLIRSVSLRQVRLVCGLVLFAYLISHFLNHALGNISMDALAAGVHYHIMFWQFLPVAMVFYGRSANGLPTGVEGGGHDLGQCRGTEPGSQPRPA